MENKQTLIGEVTADQINAWKEQHGEVFAIKVNGHVCYLDPAEGRDWVRKLDTQLRYYLHIDPDSLTDWEWAMRVNELMWIRKQEAEAARQQ